MHLIIAMYSYNHYIYVGSSIKVHSNRYAYHHLEKQLNDVVYSFSCGIGNLQIRYHRKWPILIKISVSVHHYLTAKNKSAAKAIAK